jgi:hypothetical protein
MGFRRIMTTASLSITQLLARSGSDKGKWYGGMYDILLQPIQNSIRSLVEIGVGTPALMAGYCSENYRTGGSLRAWREFLPNAQIYGLDVNHEAQLKGEPRITTYLCDSTDSAQAEEVLKRLQPQPDVIIDDGLHTKEGQIATLKNFYPALRVGGLYFIEDVWPESIEPILEELKELDPESPSFVDRSWGQCVAIVIRRSAQANSTSASVTGTTEQN